MNLSRFVFPPFFLLLSISAKSQSVAKFTNPIYNFGNIVQDEGSAECSFTFSNLGPENLKIDTIITECRCTTIDYPKNEIPKDGIGTILVEFDPSGVSGNFQKEILVQFAGLSNPTRLRVIGNAVPGVSDPKAYYKKKIGGTRFRSNYLNMGPVNNDTVIKKSFGVYNDSDTIITFLDQIGHAKHLKITIEPMALKPGETGKIHVEYDAKALGELGNQSDMITLASDELNRNAIKYLNIAANVMYAFPEMTEEEKNNAANIRFEKKEHQFGDILQGKTVETTFNFSNTGKKPLEILQTSVSCGCTAGEPDKEIYQPGESGEIKISFNSEGRGGKQNKYITVYTNSPSNPVVELRIYGNVKTDIPEGK